LEKKEIILLPGTGRQVEILKENLNEEIKSILVIGSGLSAPAKILRDHYNAEVFQVVEDRDSLILERLLLKEEKNPVLRLMDFTSTDFKKNQFDLVYAQASVSDKRRSRIIKEVKRILKPGGIFCAGEITRLKDDPPPFVKNVWEASAINPLPEDELNKFYSERNFEILIDKDLRFTLTEYYSVQSDLLPEKSGELRDNEKSYYKKLLNRISHESNVYLKLGGDKYMGYRMLIMRKTAE
jgi:SAM-dependent methyltransferase